MENATSTGDQRAGGAAAREGSQAERHAEQAKEKMAERREDQSGVSGWVSGRASVWSLDGPDWDFMARQKYLWNPLMDYWFRMEIEGWENIPDPPRCSSASTPARHSSGTPGRSASSGDGISAATGRCTAPRTTHSWPCPAWAATSGAWASCQCAGQHRRGACRRNDVALWPGGERDSLRPWTKRDEAVLAGRMGFIKLAIRRGVPIVPISTVGGPDSMPVVASGRRLAKVLALDKVARLKMFPIAIQLPWGISPALLPEVPLPTKIRTAFQEPIEVDSAPDRADDKDYVEAKYEEVQNRIQQGMNVLARRRRLPLFG